VQAFELIEALAEEIGPRRPASRGEERAAEVVRDALAKAGAKAAIEPFDGYSSFAWPYGVITALALAPAPLPMLALGLLAAEGGLIWTPVSDALARAPSRNVVATIEPAGPPERTLCLMAHLDTSRSGLLFDPRVGPLLRRLFVGLSASAVALAAAPLLRRSRLGRTVLRGSRALSVAGLALLAEREVRGQDVPGANDNASGAGVAVQLAAERLGSPLESTRLVVLVCGCEESGLLGARAFLDTPSVS